MKATQLSARKLQLLLGKPFGKEPKFWASLLPGFTKALSDIRMREEEKSGESQPGDVVDKEGPISEAALESLVMSFPDVLPWKELPGFQGETPFVLGRNVRNGPATDVLFLEAWGQDAGPDAAQGRLVIVETKLVKNAEIYRTVLGQVLQYAAELTSDPDLPEKLSKIVAGRKTLNLPGTCDPIALQKAVEAARAGDIRLLIVSDEIPGELARAVSFVPKLLISAIEVIVASGE